MDVYKQCPSDLMAQQNPTRKTCRAIIKKKSGMRCRFRHLFSSMPCCRPSDSQRYCTISRFPFGLFQSALLSFSSVLGIPYFFVNVTRTSPRLHLWICPLPRPPLPAYSLLCAISEVYCGRNSQSRGRTTHCAQTIMMCRAIIFGEATIHFLMSIIFGNIKRFHALACDCFCVFFAVGTLSWKGLGTGAALHKGHPKGSNQTMTNGLVVTDFFESPWCGDQ